MKRYIQRISILLTLGLIAGCDNYLEETPDNRVELNTTEKAAQLLTNAYSQASYKFTEWMTDNVTFTTGTVRLLEHNQAYQWEDVTPDDQDTPTYFWTSTYDAIAHANEVLAVIDALPGERAQKRAVEGEALLTRAYGHFMLVNLFAKHFDPETASGDAGIPYVEEPEREFIKQYDRQSVREVYDKIEDDLLDGIRLVNESFYANSGRYHFTRNAALAFASRFYLFKGDYEKCIEYSSQMLGNDPTVFIKDIEGILLQTANPNEFIQEFVSPTDQSNLLMIRNVTNFPVNVGYWPSPTIINNMYDSNPWFVQDIRTSNEYPIYLRGTGWALAKYEFLFERTSLTSNVGLYYTIMPVFRGEEVLLNRAEAHALANNIPAALADLQVIVNQRYEGDPELTIQALRNYYGSANDLLITLQFILDERQKEFMHEGLRWFDIRRYGLQVSHFTEQGQITLERDDPRKVLQIPKAAIDVGGLEPNPR